jgi:uncharacterized protein YceH (UPF0502 family)
MKQIPVPTATTAQQAAILALVDRILIAKARGTAADVSKWEKEIDNIVFALYSLSPEEIAVVTQALK